MIVLTVIIVIIVEFEIFNLLYQNKLHSLSYFFIGIYNLYYYCAGGLIACLTKPKGKAQYKIYLYSFFIVSLISSIITKILFELNFNIRYNATLILAIMFFLGNLFSYMFNTVYHEKILTQLNSIKF